MPIESVYVPHHAGTVLGSRFQRPWIAESADHALSVEWQGQPVFTSRGEAFEWLAAVRANTGAFRIIDFAVAHVQAEAFVHTATLRRVHVNHQMLIAAESQVLRASPDAPGPHASVLRACYNAVHEAVAYHWANATARAVPEQERVTDLVFTIWQRTYPLGYRDAQEVFAARVGRAAELLLADAEQHGDIDVISEHGLASLLWEVDRAVQGEVATAVPPPPPATIEDAHHLCSDPGRGGWRYATDRVWSTALATGAVDGLLAGANDLAAAWNTRYHAFGRTDMGLPASLHEQAVTGWLRRSLTDANRSVLAEWTHAAGSQPGSRAGTSATQRDADLVDGPRSAAGRAYPSVPTVDPSALPIDPHRPVNGSNPQIGPWRPR